VPAPEIAHQARQLRRRFDTELGHQHRAVAVETFEGLHLVALGEKDLDQSAVRALAQRLGPDRGERRDDRFGPPALLGEVRGHRLERVQTKLVPLLVLDQDPVVVPAGQQIDGERRDRGCGLVAGQEIARRIEQPVREGA
jgi:hypothetical protein